MMCKGEQYGLKWSDIDFNQRVITLRDTKNGESRLVYMFDDVVESIAFSGRNFDMAIAVTKIHH